MKPDRLLFLDTYTDPTFKSISSAEIGFGISCANSIKSCLRRRNLSLIECSPKISDTLSKMDWVYESYKYLNNLAPKQNDVIFIFNSLIHFPGEVRRLVNHHTKVGCPIIGYTHGSHWDKTDAIRAESSPKLLHQDLANMLTYDRLFVVSEYYRELLRKNLMVLGPVISERFDQIVRVVGLPIDMESIDKANNRSKKLNASNEVRIVFNHSLRPPKQPSNALNVIERIMSTRDNCSFEITRAFIEDTQIEKDFKNLAKKYKNRIIFHNNLTLNDYYELLWNCDIQFSTASHESFGVSTIEAMYTGNACFTPDKLSYPEITGGIGNYQDIDDLAEMVKKAIDDDIFRTKISEAQRSLAMRYGPSVIVDKIVKIIDEMVP